MATKFEIEQRIIDNTRERKLSAGIPKLEFLVPVKISEEFLESDVFSSLKNSRTKKWVYLAIALVHIVAISQLIAKFELSQIWNVTILGMFILSGTWFVWKFLENRTILKIAPDGLTIYPTIFFRWEDIEYLYFHTKYDDVGSVIGIYLVVNSKTCSNYEIMVNNLQWSIEKLGRILYQCMRKYKK